MVPLELEKIQIDNRVQVLKDISSLYLNAKFSDVILVVEGEEIYAHKTILAARSGLFASLLFENSETKYTIPQVSVKTFKAFLKYIYTGEVVIDMTNKDVVLQLMDLAHQHSFKNMEITSILNLDNFCSILNAANLYDFTELRDQCHIFFDKSAEKILQHEDFQHLTEKSLLKLLKRDTVSAPPVEIFKAVAKWHNTNNPSDNSVLSTVCLPLLGVLEIVSYVWPFKLKNEELLSRLAKIVTVKTEEETEVETRLLVDENLATLEHKAQVVTGTNTDLLLTGNQDVDKGAWCNVGNKDGITIKLGFLAFINNINLKLFDGSGSYYSYYIEVSTNQKQWKKVIDYSSYSCRSLQTLYFKPELVQYIRVVGTRSSLDNNFNLTLFQAYYQRQVLTITNGIITPTINVATPAKNAIVLKGENPNELINGNFNNFTGAEGFAHHTIGKDNLLIQLAQPYSISSMKLRLWDQDNRFYKYYIETSVNNSDWEMAVDRRSEDCRSWQDLRFNERSVVFVKITGTYNSANQGFHVVHFECPSTT